MEKTKAKKPVKKEHKLTMCEVTQQTDKDYFNWTDDEKAVLDNGTAMDIIAVITSRLKNAGYIVQECHCIIHDKDTDDVWDESHQTYYQTPIDKHFHMYCKFLKTPNGDLLSGTLAQIAVAVGVEPQYIGKASPGRYGWDNMLAYAIHAKDAHKHRYDPAEVASFGSYKKEADGAEVPMWTPYIEIYAARKKAWEAGRARKTAERAALGADELEEKILTGKVTKNQVLLSDDMFEVYARNKRRCDDAFDTYASRKIAQTIQAMENGEFKLTVYFITGRSHAGKSIYTDCLVDRIQADAREQLGQEWKRCDCAATNPFDEYDGGEILVMDDVRGVALSSSDWLKLLDPDRINIGSARYRNKKIAARVIIINSEKDILDFFYYAKGAGGGDRSEAMDQFFRRILARAIVYRVPEDDTRRLLVGHMRETAPYELDEPGAGDNSNKLTLHHDFKDEQDLSYEDSIDYLAGLVMSRNRLKDMGTT